MATIHNTTLVPSKVELLTAWLPGRPWYRGGTPQLSKAGGFRVDDPDGEVGIELMIVADGDGARYFVPMTYRGAPLDGADDALMGTSEHGVLGRRWIYDGLRDPVAVEQLVALAAGRVQAQAQNVSDTLDPSVRPAPALSGDAAPVRPLAVTDTGTATSIELEGGLSLLVVRRLADDPARDGDRPADRVAAVEADVPGLGRRAVLAVVRSATRNVA